MNINQIEEAANEALDLKDLDDQMLLISFIRLAYHTGSKQEKAAKKSDDQKAF